MKKKQSLFLFAASIAAIITWITVPSEEERYLELIQEHSYFNRKPISKQELKAIPKHDRPDLVIEREIALTMNPELGRPTPEVLVPTIKKVNELRRVSPTKTLPGSEEAQAKWVERGPNDYGGRTRAVMFDPNDPTNKKVWAGGVGGGLWYNNDITNADSAWHGLSDLWANMAVTAIDYDRQNTNVMYVGTGEGWLNADAIRGFGVWKTEDGGLTWNQLASTAVNSFNTVQSIKVHPVTSEVLVGTASGLYLSSDNGDSFERVFSGFIADVEFSADNYLYIATGNAQNTGKIYGSNSVNGPFNLLSGNGLPNTNSIGRVQVTAAPSAPAVVYVLTHNDVNNDVEGIYRSNNYGSSWTKLNMPTWSEGGNFARGQAWYDLISGVSPLDEDVVFVGGVDLFRSNDGGNSWTQISYWNASRTAPNYVHADHHELVFVPGSDTLLLSGSDGGISITYNLGDAWETRNLGYNVTQFYAGDIHPEATRSLYIAGAQDNGSILVDDGANFGGARIGGGDGAYCFIDQDEPQYAFVSSQYGNFRRLRNWNYDAWVIGGSTGSFINPADYDDKENILYTVINGSSSRINRISNATGNVNREELAFSGGSGSVTNIKVSPYSESGVSNIFVGMSSGRVIFVTDAQSDNLLESVDLNVPGFGSVSSIDVGESDDQLLVTRSNYGTVSVYYTEDRGDNWVNVEGDLPDMPVRWGIFNPTDRREVLLATEVGVWGTTSIIDNSVKWLPMINGFANTRVDMLQYRESDYQVLAITHGRGMYSSDAFSILGQLEVDFKADRKYINPGEEVKFTNVSKGFANSYTWTFEGAETTTFEGTNPPKIKYINSGCYKVKLHAKQDTANIVVEKECFVVVRPTACNNVFEYNVELDTVFATIPTVDAASFQVAFYDRDSLNLLSGLYNAGYTDDWAVKDLKGDVVLAAASKFSPSGKADNWIVIGPLTIPEEKVKFGWAHKYFANSFRDGYEVWASADGTNPEAIKASGALLSKYKDNDALTDGNTELTYNEIELSPELLGKQIYFGFRHTANDQYVLGLDEFTLSVCEEIPALAPNVDFIVNNELINVGETVKFTDLTANFPTSWLWDFSDGTGDNTEQNPEVTFNEKGCKEIKLVATNEIGADSVSYTCFVNVIDPSSITEYNGLEVDVYPNPFKSNLRIKTNSTGLLSVYSFNGQLIANETISSEITLRTSKWSSGVYFINFIDDEGNRITQKLVKE